MPIDDNTDGISSSSAVFNFDHRMCFYEPKPGDQWMNFHVEHVNGSSVSASMPVDDIPQVFQSQLQDWIALAHSKPPPDPGAVNQIDQVQRSKQ